MRRGAGDAELRFYKIPRQPRCDEAARAPQIRRGELKRRRAEGLDGEKSAGRVTHHGVHRNSGNTQHYLERGE